MAMIDFGASLATNRYSTTASATAIVPLLPRLSECSADAASTYRHNRSRRDRNEFLHARHDRFGRLGEIDRSRNGWRAASPVGQYTSQRLPSGSKKYTPTHFPCVTPYRRALARLEARKIFEHVGERVAAKRDLLQHHRPAGTSRRASARVRGVRVRAENEERHAAFGIVVGDRESQDVAVERLGGLEIVAMNADVTQLCNAHARCYVQRCGATLRPGPQRRRGASRPRNRRRTG